MIFNYSKYSVQDIFIGLVSNRNKKNCIELKLCSCSFEIKAFLIEDMEDLEEKLRFAVAEGMPRTHRPWKKILIVVEGIYR